MQGSGVFNDRPLGRGLWSLRHTHPADLHPHMLVAAVDGVPFEGRKVFTH